jgi:mRNA interferase MazF
MARAPRRGEVWYVNLEPVAGSEHGAKRPCVVVSDDRFNRGVRNLVVVVPLTTRDKGIFLRTPVCPPEGGLKQPSFAMPDHIRAVSVNRFGDRLGALRTETMDTLMLNVLNLLGIDAA